MTSTNDGKDVKSNQTVSPKGKAYYIEAYNSLEAGLNSNCDLAVRTRHLCEAWRRIHGLCQHSTPPTHPYFFVWIQKHTAKTILQTKWQDSSSKTYQANLTTAINEFIAESHAAIAARNGESRPWENFLIQRGEWFKKTILNPWGHGTLKKLIVPDSDATTEEEFVEWLKEERGVMVEMRLRHLAITDCKDLALRLTSAIMDRRRAETTVQPDANHSPEKEENPKAASKEMKFTEILKMQAGFTEEVWDILTDIELVLLHKFDKRPRCIELAKRTPLHSCCKLVERLETRLENHPKEKRLWKNANEVATLIAQVTIARCMVVGSCSGACFKALDGCARALARLVTGARLVADTAALAAPAATARHLHTLAAAVHAQSTESMKPFVCELYVRALTAGMNELERLKMKTEKASEARALEQTLSTWFTTLGSLLGGSPRVRCECLLTAFSVHPSQKMYEAIRNAPHLPPLKIDVRDNNEATSEFGSWANDSRSQTNLVKTSETLNIKQKQQLSNILSTAILTEGEALGLGPELCQDIAVLLSGPRLKTLSWAMDREVLLDNCRHYIERTHGGTRALTTELKYLNLDPKEFQHLPEEDDEEENDLFYGIEKGYEHLVEFPEPEEIWENAMTSQERTASESQYSSGEDSGASTVRRKKKPKQLTKVLTEESHPLSFIAEAKRKANKKERHHSKERCKDSSRKKIMEDPLDIREHVQQTDIDTQNKEKKKEKRMIKKKDKSLINTSSLSRLVGMKVAKQIGNDYISNISVSDSDYDSQGKYSLNSINSECSENVLFDGLYCMDDMKSEMNTKVEKVGFQKNKELSLVSDSMTIRKTPITSDNTGNMLTPFGYNTSNTKAQSVDNKNEVVSSMPRVASSLPPNVVAEKVKKSITRLIEFRRNKNVPGSITEGNNLTQIRSDKPTHSNISNGIIGSENNFHNQITPKVVTIPDIPKAYINKNIIEEPEQKCNEEIEHVYNENIKNKITQPVAQLAHNNYITHDPSMIKVNNFCNDANRVNPTNNQLNQSIFKAKPSNMSQNPKTYNDSTMQSQKPKNSFHSTEKSSIQNFLKELQKSINAGAALNNNKYSIAQTEITRKEAKPMSRVTPVIPAMKNDQAKLNHAIKRSIPQKLDSHKKLDNSLNTFSRLNYIHKNYQNDTKIKQVVDALIDLRDKNIRKSNSAKRLDRPLDHINQNNKIPKNGQSKSNVNKAVSCNIPYNNTLFMNTKAEPTTKISSQSVKSTDSSRLNVLESNQTSRSSTGNKNENQTIKIPLHNKIVADSIRQTTLLSDRDQNDLLSLLRQQYKLNTITSLPKSNLVSNSEDLNVHVTQASYSSNHNYSTSKMYNTCTNVSQKFEQIDKPSIRNSNFGNTSFHSKMQTNSDLKSAVAAPKSTTKTSRSRSKNSDSDHLNIKKTEIIKSCELSKQKTQNIPSKGNTSTDWESVMNAILAQKTPSRGPKALDVALNKSSFAKAFTDSLKDRNMEKNKLFNEHSIMKSDPKHNNTSTIKTSSTGKDKSYNTTKRVTNESKKDFAANNCILEPNLNKNNILKLPPNNIETPNVPTSLRVPSNISNSEVLSTNLESTEALSTDDQKQFTSTLPQLIDPFISGIDTSDYDLLEELMDDDLRKEIGELSSDEDNFNAQNSLKRKNSISEKHMDSDLDKICENLITAKPAVPVIHNLSHTKKNNVPILKCDVGLENVYVSEVSPNITFINNNKELHKTQNDNSKRFTGFKEQSNTAIINDIQNESNQNLNIKIVDQSVISAEPPNNVNNDIKNDININIFDQSITTNTPNVLTKSDTPQTFENLGLIDPSLSYESYSNLQLPIETRVNDLPPNTYIELHKSSDISSYQGQQFNTPDVNSQMLKNTIITPMSNQDLPEYISESLIASQIESPSQFVYADLLNTTMSNNENFTKTELCHSGIEFNLNLGGKLNDMNKNIDTQATLIDTVKNNEHNVLFRELEKQTDVLYFESEKKDRENNKNTEIFNDSQKENEDRLILKRLFITSRITHNYSSGKPIPLDFKPLSFIASNNSEIVEHTTNSSKEKVFVEKVDNCNTKHKSVINEKTRMSENNTQSTNSQKILLRSSNRSRQQCDTSNVEVQSDDDKKIKINSDSFCNETHFVNNKKHTLKVNAKQIVNERTIMKTKGIQNGPSIVTKKNVRNTKNKVQRQNKDKVKGKCEKSLTNVSSVKGVDIEQDLIVSRILNNDLCEPTMKETQRNRKKNKTSKKSALVVKQLNRTKELKDSTNKLPSGKTIDNVVKEKSQVNMQPIEKLTTEHIIENVVYEKYQMNIDKSKTEKIIENAVNQKSQRSKQPYEISTNEKITKSVVNNNLQVIKQSLNKLTTGKIIENVVDEKYKVKKQPFDNSRTEMITENVGGRSQVKKQPLDKSTIEKITENVDEKSQVDKKNSDMSTTSKITENLDEKSQTDKHAGRCQPSKALEPEDLIDLTSDTKEPTEVTSFTKDVNKTDVQEKENQRLNCDENRDKNSKSTNNKHENKTSVNKVRKFNSTNTKTLKNVPQGYKDSIKIIPLPNDSKDPCRKFVRIKLPNGRTFKATAYGKTDVDFDTLFADPSLKSVLLSGLSDKTRYTLNIKQVATTRLDNPNKILETRIQEINLEAKAPIAPLETIDLLSDDEDIVTYETLKTEFGAFKIRSLKKDNYTLHQKKFDQYCTVQLIPLKLEQENTTQEIITCRTSCSAVQIMKDQVDQSTKSAITIKEKDNITNFNDMEPRTHDLFNNIQETTTQNKPNITELGEKSDDTSNNIIAEQESQKKTMKKLPDERAVLETPNVNVSDSSQTQKPVNKMLFNSDQDVVLPSISKYKECYVKLVNCDDIVIKYEKSKICKQKCFIDLVRCDVTVDRYPNVKHSQFNNIEAINEQFEGNTQYPLNTTLPNFIVDNMPKTPTFLHECGRSSPVVDVFEEIVLLNSKLSTQVCSVKSDNSLSTCNCEWLVSKPQLNMLSKMNQLNNDYRSEDNWKSNSVSYNIIPKLTTLLTKYFQNNPVVYRLKYLRAQNNNTKNNHSQNLKRKLSIDEDTATRKISKIETAISNGQQEIETHNAIECSILQIDPINVESEFNKSKDFITTCFENEYDSDMESNNSESILTNVAEDISLIDNLIFNEDIETKFNKRSTDLIQTKKDINYETLLNESTTLEEYSVCKNSELVNSAGLQSHTDSSHNNGSEDIETENASLKDEKFSLSTYTMPKENSESDLKYDKSMTNSCHDKSLTEIHVEYNTTNKAEINDERNHNRQNDQIYDSIINKDIEIRTPKLRRTSSPPDSTDNFINNTEQDEVTCKNFHNNESSKLIFVDRLLKDNPISSKTQESDYNTLISESFVDAKSESYNVHSEHYGDSINLKKDSDIDLNNKIAKSTIMDSYNSEPLLKSDNDFINPVIQAVLFTDPLKIEKIDSHNENLTQICDQSTVFNKNWDHRYSAMYSNENHVPKIEFTKSQSQNDDRNCVFVMCNDIVLTDDDFDDLTETIVDMHSDEILQDYIIDDNTLKSKEILSTNNISRIATTFDEVKITYTVSEKNSRSGYELNHYNDNSLINMKNSLMGNGHSEVVSNCVNIQCINKDLCIVSNDIENTTGTTNILEVIDNVRPIDNNKHDNLFEEDSHFTVLIPKITYATKLDHNQDNVNKIKTTTILKRKISMNDIKTIRKKYRKGKNIDQPKFTRVSIRDNLYSVEFQRLCSYFSSLKFSYSQPFHIEYIDVPKMLTCWPIRNFYPKLREVEDSTNDVLFKDLENIEISTIITDPLKQTLAEELNSHYDESTYILSDIKESNFNMGFGEGSGRVIQNLQNGEYSKFSAATLSDVKQNQPFLLSENYDAYLVNHIALPVSKDINTDDQCDVLIGKDKNRDDHNNVPPINKTINRDDQNSVSVGKDINTDDDLYNIQNYLSYIQLKNKVRDFFRKTSNEFNLMKRINSKSKDDKDIYDTSTFPFGLTQIDFFEPAPVETIVNVVQVGQLPVSAAAQNPMTCDPRVTQVSNASPPQCSENNLNDDSQTPIKTEYTELTTADLSLPLLHDYATENEAEESPESSNIPVTGENIPIQTEIKSIVKIELMEELSGEKTDDCESPDRCQSPESNKEMLENVDYTFDTNSMNASDSHPNIHNMYSSEEKPCNSTENYLEPKKQNDTEKEKVPEKTDQIAHAMNAAGISTTTESDIDDITPTLVNVIPENPMTTNNYSTGIPNAMSLQQALAQILPPVLNQNGDNSQHSSSTPQVLHIVQGKNATGNQITLVDNSQQSVINGPISTPLLHFIQNKATPVTSNTNGNVQQNSFSGISLVDTGLQQGGNQLLQIVNTGNQKNNNGNLLKRVNLLTNLANVQGANDQKMVQFLCKSADGKAIQLNAPHQRGMVLRLQPVDPPTMQTNSSKPQDSQELSPPLSKEVSPQQEIKSRSVYEENYAKFIQNSASKHMISDKATSLPKFNQAFGKQGYQDGGPKQNEINGNNSHLQSMNTGNENIVCSPSESALNLDHINQITSPPMLMRKSPAQTTQPHSNFVQQIKQTIAPMNIQSMQGSVIYRQIPVNLANGQTINFITVPNNEIADESNQKQQTDVDFMNQSEMEQSIIKIVPQDKSTPNVEPEENNPHINVVNENSPTSQQPVLTQMRIKLPMLSKNPQMVSGTRVVGPPFFQIQRNVMSGANQQVYQQLVLTAAPPLGQQTAIRHPQPQNSTTSSESQMSSSTLEQLREFDLVLEQVKERSTVQPNGNTNISFPNLQETDTPVADGDVAANPVNAEPSPEALYSVGNNQPLNMNYVNRQSTIPTPTTSTYVRSPDSSGIMDSPPSSSHAQIPQTVATDPIPTEIPVQPKPAKSKSKPRPKASSNPPSTLKFNTIPTKTTVQKPCEDEQTTQRILYILAEYKEQVENSPDKDKPAPRRRTNFTTSTGSSKRKKSSSSSRRPGARDLSPIHGDDTCRTMGSEDSSCGTSQGECNECLEQSPQGSPRKVVRKLSFEQDVPANVPPRQIPPRNVIVADGQTITVARSTTGKPATAVLMPANYILPVSMVKGGQQIAIVTNRGPKLLTVTSGEGGTTNALLVQRVITPAGLKPVIARPGIRHVRLPAAALQALNLTPVTAVHPPDSTVSPAPAPTPPELVDTRANSSPWAERDSQEAAKPDRASSPEATEPWHLPTSTDLNDYSYEETVRTDNMDRTVLGPIPDRYSPDMEAQRIFDKMFDVDAKRPYMIDSQADSPQCGCDVDTSDCDDKAYPQIVHKKEGLLHRQHRLTHVSSAALRHKYAILEHELRLQKSLSEECEDLGVDSPSASELFPEAELLFSASPAHDHSTQDQGQHSHTPQPTHSSIPQPDIDDQIATDQLLPREEIHDQLGLEDVGIVTVSEDGLHTAIAIDHEEFARSHPNTTFHSEPTDDSEMLPVTITGLKGRHITSTIFHSNRPSGTVLVTAPQTTVISQAISGEGSSIPTPVKYSDIENMIDALPHVEPNHFPSVLVKDDGLTRYDNILTGSRELHLTNTPSAIVHSTGNATQVIRRVGYEEIKRDANTRYLVDESHPLIAGDDPKMVGEDTSRDAMLDSMHGGVEDDRSSPERNTELFWESNSASERSESRRPLDYSSDSEKCCKSPYDETNSTDSGSVGTHLRLDSVIKDARGMDRGQSADCSSAEDTHPPLRTYPPKRLYHSMDGEFDRSFSGKTRAGDYSPDLLDVRRRASMRGVVKRGCHCCSGSPAPPRSKKSRQKKLSSDFVMDN